MVALDSLVQYCDGLLAAEGFSDYCPNGLQVEGAGQVQRLACGVSACQQLLDAAVQWGADALLVHHGYFWKGEPAPLTGLKGRRVRTLLNNNLSLIVYHLPLDAHPELGNNAGLGRDLGVSVAGRFGAAELGMYGELAVAQSPAALAGLLGERLQRTPLHIPGGAQQIRRIGWCSGAAQGYIEDAAALGLDAYISGEISEPTVHLARELGIHYFAAGHHATERYGVRALGRHLAERFDLDQCFIDIPNPV